MQDKNDGKPLCNACGLYFSKNDAPRPKVLWKNDEQQQGQGLVIGANGIAMPAPCHGATASAHGPGFGSGGAGSGSGSMTDAAQHLSQLQQSALQHMQQQQQHQQLLLFTQQRAAAVAGSTAAAMLAGTAGSLNLSASIAGRLDNSSDFRLHVQLTCTSCVYVDCAVLLCFCSRGSDLPLCLVFLRWLSMRCHIIETALRRP